jgi:hypothetical protein
MSPIEFAERWNVTGRGLAVTRRELEVINEGERYARRLQAPTTERTLADLGAADEERVRCSYYDAVPLSYLSWR